MLDLTDGRPEHHERREQLRQAILARFVDLFSDIEYKDIFDADFEVARTADRKGWRDPRSFHNDSPYQEDLKVRISLTLELPDEDWGVELVEQLAAFEGELERGQAQAEVDRAQAELARAQAALTRAKGGK